MNIQVSDPFITTLVGTPLTEGAAAGSSALDTQQRGAEIGEVIPIVFCRRVGDTGGVLISPAATEARFEDASPSGDVTAYYHLILSEGQIDSIQVRDVFQRSCRVGSFTQTYNRRAGTFTAGNFIDNSPNLEAPYYCGTGGSYAGMSTMAFNVTIPAGFDQWNRQVHCFVRGGMHVTRLLDSALGPSNNVADLLRYLLANSSRVAADQIDTTSLLAAARFTDTNGLWFNGVLAESTNVRDWMNNVLPYFLLRSSRAGGKEALRPLLPTITATGAINTGAVSWSFTFTEEHIVPGSFQITYTPLADRKPFCALVLWRQQPTDDIGLIRSTEVRYTGTAEDGPFEQHDLSAFCASENHAVKVGAYILARRKHITHTLAITVRPDAFNETLSPGDLVRVRLERIPSTGASSLHNELYEVDRIGKSLSGEVQLELTQFPVDSQLRSVVALEVDAAVGNGVLLPTGKTGVSCDVNSSGDTSIPTETWSSFGGFAGAYDSDVEESESSDIDDLAVNNPSDGALPSGELSYPDPLRVGDEVTAPIICDGGRIKWYRLDPSVDGGKVYLTQGPSYTMIINDKDYSVYSEVECPDPSSPTGYSEPITLGSTPIVQTNLPEGFTNITGTISTDGNTVMSYTLTYKYWDKIAAVCTTIAGGNPLVDPRVKSQTTGPSNIKSLALVWTGSGQCTAHTRLEFRRISREGVSTLQFSTYSPVGGIELVSLDVEFTAVSGTAAPWDQVWIT